jgi:glycosyltransferase involved in cell wall biosynthesis
MAFRGLGPLVQQVRPDLVHVLNEPWSLVALQSSRSSGARLVTQGCENLWDQGSALEARIRRLATRRTLARSSGFVSWNPEGVAWAKRRGLAEGSPTLVLSSVLPRLERFEHPESRRAEGRSMLGLGHELVIGYVGRLIPEKGISWLLESWKAAALPGESRLVFVGDGPLAGVVRAAAGSDPRIHAVPSVPLDRVPEVMASLDALVLPSITTRDWREQFGRVLTEAMASGVPIIASDSGSIPDVVGDAGIVVREGSVEQLASSLAQVAADPDVRRDLSEKGLLRARSEFAPASGADRIRAFWESVLRGGQP